MWGLLPRTDNRLARNVVVEGNEESFFSLVSPIGDALQSNPTDASERKGPNQLLVTFFVVVVVSGPRECA